MYHRKKKIYLDKVIYKIFHGFFLLIIVPMQKELTLFNLFVNFRISYHQRNYTDVQFPHYTHFEGTEIIGVFVIQEQIGEVK